MRPTPKSAGVVSACTCLAFALVVTASSLALAGEEIIEGSLSGGGGPAFQEVAVPQFDDLGGTRVLQGVRFELLTVTSGGYTTDGSGTAVDILASLTADYSFEGESIADTEARIEMTVPNPAGAPMISVSVFDSDPVETTVTDGTFLAAWTGTGEVLMTVFSEFIVEQTPTGVIGFGAGGSVYYTIVYEFGDAPTGPTFIRGDVNDDGSLDIADPVRTLETLFVTGASPLDCDDAGDANDDGSVDISDAVYVLSALFTGGPNPTAPYPACGVDPTADPTGCETVSSCP